MGGGGGGGGRAEGAKIGPRESKMFVVAAGERFRREEGVDVIRGKGRGGGGGEGCWKRSEG